MSSISSKSPVKKAPTGTAAGAPLVSDQAGGKMPGETVRSIGLVVAVVPFILRGVGAVE